MPQKVCMKQFLSQLPIALILVITAFVFFRYQEYFQSTLDPERSAELYGQSQYVLGEGSEAKISDSQLYEFAGYAYWQGADPTTINFEHPPLGKYYYGIFYHFLGNPYWGSLLLFALVLFACVHVSKLIGLTSVAQSIVVVLVGSLSLLQVHTRYALLDLPQLLLTLLFFSALLSLQVKLTKKWILLLGLSLGLLLSVKYMIPLILIPLFFVVVQSYIQRHVVSYLAALLIAGFIYLLSYSMFFVHGGSIMDFVAFEWYRVQWFMGKTDAPMFLIFQTLFTGSFETWWEPGSYETTLHWSVLWPVYFLLSLFGFAWAATRRQLGVVVLLLFSYLLIILYSIGAAASDRFFIQLLPFWILAVVWMLDLVLQKVNDAGQIGPSKRANK